MFALSKYIGLDRRVLNIDYNNISNGGIQIGSLKRVFKAGVQSGAQKGYSKMIFKAGFQSGYSKRIFKRDIQKGYSKRVFKKDIQIPLTLKNRYPTHFPICHSFPDNYKTPYLYSLIKGYKETSVDGVAASHRAGG